MPNNASSIDELAINTIRTLAMDAVEAANSGHPGTPMALAPVAFQLWTQTLNYDPADPLWPNRDRYVLSCGHASMLLYSLLHLAGVHHVDSNGKVLNEPTLPLEELKRFRQLHSCTPGHPEWHYAAGIETTTGPLGQGCGNSVGMAIASKWLAARYNRADFEVFNFNVYVQCSDGDLMEGVSNEAASLAGHLQLDNLCWIYDDNQITIEGKTELAFSEDVETRFRGLGWHVERVADANDRGALDKAIKAFQAERQRPTMIIVKSVIAYGAPNKAGTAEAHGAPLGAKEVELTKRALGWPVDAKFLVPDEVKEHFQATIGRRGRVIREAWQKLFAAYRLQHPELADDLKTMWSGKLPEGWDSELPEFPPDEKGMATRVSSGKVLNAVAKRIPWLLGGSADLAPSTKTLLSFDGAGTFSAKDFGGRNFHFGIREHAMAAAANGMATVDLRPYGATFFVFSDYLRPSMRLSAIMKVPVIYVFTHDSIGVGEDGPTHQPIEHLAACRAIPGLYVLRPADANEVSAAWRTALQLGRPVALVLTRQDLPTLDRTKYAPANGVAQGAYVLADAPAGKPDLILMATGSEVSLAVAAHTELVARGVKVRVVSMPCFELFQQQSASYRDTVLPPSVTKRIAIEAGIRQGWDGYLGPHGVFIGLDNYGESAPYQDVFAERGITIENILATAKLLLE
ncbi:MAG: transketolase [Pirellulales bacterium]